MSNLGLAKAAIEAELSQAKQGLAYYQSHVSALEETLAQLAAISGESEAAINGSAARNRSNAAEANTATKGRRGRPPKSGKVKPVKGKAVKGTAGANALPFTGGDYWPNLVTNEPQSGVDILRASVAGLGFEPTPEQVKKLQQRMTSILNVLVMDKTIQDSGFGRARRFFK